MSRCCRRRSLLAYYSVLLLVYSLLFHLFLFFSPLSVYVLFACSLLLLRCSVVRLFCLFPMNIYCSPLHMCSAVSGEWSNTTTWCVRASQNLSIMRIVARLVSGASYAHLPAATGTCPCRYIADLWGIWLRTNCARTSDKFSAT